MEQHLRRTIGLPASIFIIIGYVIGASIFILPGSLAAKIGPGTYIVYLLAAIPAIFTCFVMAQVGSCFPRSGAIFVLLQKVCPASISFLYTWIMIIIAGVVIPLVANGFADYLGHFFVLFDTKITALLVITLFIIINISNVKLVTRTQTVMTILFITALLIFSIGGINNAEPSIATSLFPNGLSIVWISIVTSYFSYTGFFIIVEIAGEIKNPSKVIPKAIFISLIVITLVYTLIPYTLTTVLNWQTLGDTEIPVVTAAETFLPSWLASFIAMGALMASATSINGITMGISRDIYKTSKSGLFFSYFGKISDKTQIPIRAVLLTGACALMGALSGDSVIHFAQLTVLGLAIIQITTGIALLQLPGKFPELYNNLEFKLSPWMLKFVCFGYIGSSIVFLAFIAIEDPISVLYGIMFLAVGYLLFMVNSKFVY